MKRSAIAPSPHLPGARRIAAALFLLIAGAGLAAQDRITDAQWVGLLWLSWIPLLIAIWPDLPATTPPLGRSAVQMAPRGVVSAWLASSGLETMSPEAGSTPTRWAMLSLMTT